MDCLPWEETEDSELFESLASGRFDSIEEHKESRSGFHRERGRVRHFESSLPIDVYGTMSSMRRVFRQNPTKIFCGMCVIAQAGHGSYPEPVQLAVNAGQLLVRPSARL